MPLESNPCCKLLRRPTLALAALFALLTAGCQLGISEEEREAMQHVQSLGGKVNLKGGGYEVDLSRTAVTDEDLVYLKKISNLKIVAVSETQISDVGLAHLYSINSLIAVSLKQSKVTSEGVEQLRQRFPNAVIE